MSTTQSISRSQEGKSPLAKSSDAVAITRVRDVFRSYDFRTWYGSLKLDQHDFAKITPQDLSNLLTDFFQNLGNKDPLRLLDDLAQMLPHDKLEEALRVTYPRFETSLVTMQAMLGSAKFYLEKTKAAPTPALTAYLSQFFDGCITIFESIIGAFGIAEFFKQTDGEFQTDFKLQRIMTQIMLFTMLLSMLIPILGPVEATKIVGGTFGSIWALSVIYPCIKRRASQLPKFENWSKKIGLCELPCPEGRKTIVDQIAEKLIQAKKEKQHVMLIGPSGVGKTETLKALSHAISLGDYPELVGLKIFYGNTADLVNSREPLDGGNKILTHIKQAGPLNGTVQILDEIHTACKEDGAIGDQLKTELDPTGCFHMVIGVTTETEFVNEIYLKNRALARRFKIVNIEGADEDATLSILNAYLLKEAPETLLDDGPDKPILRELIKASGDGVQPLAALDLLRDCLKKTREQQKSEVASEIEQNRTKLASLQSQAAVGYYLPYDSRPQQVSQLTSEIEQLTASHRKERENAASLFQARATIAKYRNKMFGIVAKQMDASERSLSKFLLISHFMIPSMEKTLKDQSKKLGLKLFIDHDLITETAKEEKERQDRVKAAVARGQDQMTQNLSLLSGQTPRDPTEKESKKS